MGIAVTGNDRVTGRLVYDGLSIYAPYLHDIYPHPDYGTRHQARMWLGPEAPGRE